MAAMKFKFTIQGYQTDAVNSVVKVFSGQPFQDKVSYRRDAGSQDDDRTLFNWQQSDEDLFMGVANAPVALSETQLLHNIREVQNDNNIKGASSLAKHLGACSLDVEMETGTGKTYVYIKTMFELNKRYGWSKFIVVVPSIAIREGVQKSFQTMQDHFMEQYGKKARFFVYTSKNLTDIDSFSSSADLSVMIINVQAFNAGFNKEKNKEGRGGDKAARIIFSARDDFGSRKPIDVIAANRPIVILDEPQKMGGKKTQESLKEFHPLFTLNYSATHKEHHDLVYVLDALDAYRMKLVKKIEVKGVDIHNLRGTDGYLFLENIVISPKKPPRARLEFEIKYDKSIKRETRIVGVDDDLYALSKEMEQYQGYHINDVEPIRGIVTFTNTVYGYERLIQGEVDLVFAARPSSKMKDFANWYNEQIVSIPIGREAFVFFVEKDNPVDNLTADEARRIYSGEITNWKEVGGKNQEIIAFQRPEEAGSQVMMKYFMGDVPLMEPDTFSVVDAMGGVIENVKEYKNKKGAIGYTFQYFLTGLQQEKGVKMLSIDGVYPSVENIKNGTYPVTVSLVVAKLASNTDENVQKVVDFLLSKDGQEIIERTGYGPLSIDASGKTISEPIIENELPESVTYVLDSDEEEMSLIMTGGNTEPMYDEITGEEVQGLQAGILEVHHKGKIRKFDYYWEGEDRFSAHFLGRNTEEFPMFYFSFVRNDSDNTITIKEVNFDGDLINESEAWANGEITEADFLKPGDIFIKD